MTVYETVQQWLTEIINEFLKEFSAPFAVINLEQIPERIEYQNAELFSDTNDIHTRRIAGDTKHTEFKSFYLRRPFSEFGSRLENEAFFEKIKNRINERNLNGIMPRDGREWVSIEINTGIYPVQIQETDLYADYLVPLKLVFIS